MKPGEIFFFIGVAIIIYLVVRAARRPPPRQQARVEWDSQSDVTATDDRVQYSEERIKELLRQLDHPYGYWTYANVPVELDDQIARIFALDPANRVVRALMERMPTLKRDCATKMVLMRVGDLSSRAELASTVATKQKNAKEALICIEAAIADGVADPAPLREKVPALRRYVAQVEIDSFTEKAKRFEFKGNLKKALEYYQDALYSAIHDDVDDADQQETISGLTAKVEGLIAAIAKEAEGKPTGKKRPTGSTAAG